VGVILAKKNNNIGLKDLFGGLILPASLFWILYRFGFLSIIDALAVGILAAGAILFGAKYLFTKKFISFRK